MGISNPSRDSARNRSAAKTNAPDKIATAISGFFGAISAATAATRNAISFSEKSERSPARIREAQLEVARAIGRVGKPRQEMHALARLQRGGIGREAPVIELARILPRQRSRAPTGTGNSRVLTLTMLPVTASTIWSSSVS